MGVKRYLHCLRQRVPGIPQTSPTPTCAKWTPIQPSSPPPTTTTPRSPRTPYYLSKPIYKTNICVKHNSCNVSPAPTCHRKMMYATMRPTPTPSAPVKKRPATVNRKPTSVSRWGPPWRTRVASGSASSPPTPREGRCS